MKGVRLAIACCGMTFPVLLGIARARVHLPSAAGAVTAQDPNLGVQSALVAALFCGALVLYFSFFREGETACRLVAGMTIVLLLIANQRILPGIDAYVSARRAATDLMKSYDVNPDEIAVFGLPRGYGYELNYYFGRELPEWTRENGLARVIFFKTDAMPQPDQIRQSSGIQPWADFKVAPATSDGKISIGFRPNVGK